MNEYALAILVISVLSIAVFGFWLRRKRVMRLSRVDDKEYLKYIPESVSTNIWLESRREIARIWKIPPERLDPGRSLESLGKHLSFAGDSGLDNDTIEEQLRDLGVSTEDMKKVVTVGELLSLYTQVIEKRTGTAQ